MTSIKQNIEQVISEIDAAAKKCVRTADSVQLLAVSKTKPIAAIEEAIQAGQFAFGENYVQEGVEKLNTSALILKPMRSLGTLSARYNQIKAARLQKILIGFIQLIALKLLNDSMTSDQPICHH